MKRTRIILSIASLALALTVFSSCGFFESLVNMGHYEDVNGTDTSLATLTEDELFSNIDNYVQFGAMSGSTGDGFFYTAQRFSGVYTFATFEVSGKEKLKISSIAELTEGNFRAILLRDGSYVCDLPLDGSSIELEALDGSYKLRVAGESAKVNFGVQISYGEGAKPAPIPNPDSGVLM